jgi:hypothetical protein
MDKEDEEALARHRRRVEAAGRQKVRLKGNGVEMELHTAEGRLLGLRLLQKDKPEVFETLVAIVKPRGATRLPGKVSAKAVAWLKKAGMLRPDGSPDEIVAAVLDAAYVETREGALLRHPAISPSPEFSKEHEALEEDSNYWLERHLIDEDKRRGKGDGPPR